MFISYKLNYHMSHMLYNKSLKSFRIKNFCIVLRMPKFVYQFCFILSIWNSFYKKLSVCFEQFFLVKQLVSYSITTLKALIRNAETMYKWLMSHDHFIGDSFGHFIWLSWFESKPFQSTVVIMTWFCTRAPLQILLPFSDIFKVNWNPISTLARVHSLWTIDYFAK